jgi:hypothetical protein
VRACACAYTYIRTLVSQAFKAALELVFLCVRKYLAFVYISVGEHVHVHKCFRIWQWCEQEQYDLDLYLVGPEGQEQQVYWAGDPLTGNGYSAKLLIDDVGINEGDAPRSYGYLLFLCEFCGIDKL